MLSVSDQTSGYMCRELYKEDKKRVRKDKNISE